MKKITISLLLILTTCIYSFSQNVTLVTQADVDAFDPSTTTISGDLTIGDNLSYFYAITNLDNLSNITTVTGNLKVFKNRILTNVDGLSNLSSVGEDFEIYYNPDLENVDGLSNLLTVGKYFEIRYNELLTNVDGLSSLNTVGRDLKIIDNNSLTNLDGLSSLSFVEYEFPIRNNPMLEDINLPSLTAIGRGLAISENDALTNLDGLSNLASVGAGVDIWNNISLTNCCGIQNLLSTPGAIIGGVNISNNPSECSSTSEILTLSCTYSTTTYVDENATGNNDGSSWINAFIDLQDALALGANQVVKVAAGTYIPTTSSSRGASFDIPSNVNILGGFPNGGGERNPTANLTILSGEIDNITGYAGNSYHVVKVINSDNVVIDGVDIKDGNADDSTSFARARGGGIYSKGSNLILSNSTVRRNRAIYGGGLFASLSPEVRIVNSEVILNRADFGSAIFHSNETNLYLEKSRIEDNNSLGRCAIEVNNSLYTEIDNCVIANNASINANAISLVATNRDQTCIIRNSTIIGETKNKSLITILVGYGDELNLNIDNSIVAHQNPAFNKNVNVVNNGVLNFNHNNCYFQGSNVPGSGTNTLFSDIAGDLLLTADYSVDNCSPVVNAGDNSLSISTEDIDGNTRISDTTIDIGAYEIQTTCPSSMRESKDLNLEHSDVIRAYPNPVRDILNIQTDLENPTFHLFDLLGKEVLNTQAKEINLEQFPQGMYILRVMEGNELIESIKVMKE